MEDQTMNSFTRSIAAFAAAAGLTGAGIFGAAAAFADTPNGTWTGSVTVNNTLNMTLSSSTFALTGNPGDTVYTNAPGAWASPKEILTVSTNDPNGYTLSETDQSQFTNGPTTFPMMLFVNDGLTYTPFTVNQSLIEHITHGLSGGMTKTVSTDGSPYSDANGNDLYPEGAAVSLPGNAPSGTYSGAAVQYAVLGN
jgi:hypothetical protein